MWKIKLLQRQAILLAFYFLGVGVVIGGGSWVGWLCIVVFGGLFLNRLRIAIFNPDLEVLNAHSQTISDIWSEDLVVLRLIRKNYWLIWPFCLSIIAIISFLIFAIFQINNIYDTLSFWGFVAILFIIMYIMWSIYFIGFSWLGERMQSKLLDRKTHIVIDMLKNYLFSIPFLVILAILSVIFYLIPDKKDLGRGTSTSLMLLIGALKHFAYINLTRVVLADKRISFREAYADFGDNKIKYLNIWMFSGSIFIIPFVVFGAIAMISSKFSTTLPDVMMALTVLSIIFSILLSLLFEQIRHLTTYLKLHYHDNIKVKDFLEV